MKLIPITIHLEENTIKLIQDIVSYKNHDNFIHPSKNKPIDFDIEDFITACVNDKLDEIKNYFELVDYEKLTSEGKLKNRFKEFLDKTNMKQKELAEKVNIHRSNISMFVSNQNQPSLETFIRIWIVFKCPPIHELLYREVE